MYIISFIWMFYVAVSSNEIKGDIELLKTLALMNKANQDAIMTWKGRVSFITTLTSSDLDIIGMESHYNIEYAYDISKNTSMYYATQTLKRGKRGGKEFYEDDYVYHAGIRLPEGIYTRGPWRAHDDDGSSMQPNLIFKQNDDHKQSDFSVQFNAYRYFNIHGMNAYNRLMFYYDVANNNPNKDITITNENNVVTIVIQSSLKSGTNATSKYVFDLNKGGCPLLIEVIMPNESEYRAECSFQKYDTIWVPVSAQVYAKTYKNGEMVSITELKLNWLEQELNKYIHADTFDAKTIGTKKGDKVIDRRTNVEYRYDESLKLPGVAKPGRFWTTAAVLGLGGAALLIALLVLWLRRRKRRRADHAMA